MNRDKQLKAPSLLYRLLFPIWFIFWLIHAVIHASKYKEPKYILHRLGIFPRPKNNSILIHASSVGEVNLISPLCERLIAQGHALSISTFTATGFQRANQLFSKQAQIVVIPIDCWPISWLFVNRLKAKCILIAETELWPELLYQIAKTNAPLIHINARLSGKSLKTSKIIKRLLKQTLSYFNVHLTRYKEDVHHFLSMGVDKDNIVVMGNLKYSLTHESQSFTNIIQQPYILFASTHSDEEAQFASLLNDNDFNAPLLVIAPRHPTRLENILKSLSQIDILSHHIAIRSKHQTITKDTKIYLADTLGEMNSLFQHALMVVMGGSFVDVGGHNVLEPAALGACIITGPSDLNIKQDIHDLKQQNGIIQVASLSELKIEMQRLLSHKNTTEVLGRNAAQFVLNSQQVLDLYATKINQLIDDKPLKKEPK